MTLVNMGKYNFDEKVDRNNTHCMKYDARKKYFDNEHVKPLWVADMDFKTPDFIVEAMQKRLEHEIYGYTFKSDSLYETIINWLQKRHNWPVKKDWITFMPGVVPSLNIAVNTFTQPGDKIIIQTPVYFHFYSAVKDHGRTLVTNPLRLNNGRYEMDFDHLEKIIDKDVKMFVFCSPHNPTGNVWTQDELNKLADICLRNNILIISDEIHADIIYQPNKHIPTASLSAEISENTITLMAASKTFNFAGLSTSYTISSNKELLDRMDSFIKKYHLHMGNIFGNVALESAYDYGEEWLGELIDYLGTTTQYVKNYLETNIPKIKLIDPEATFLHWLDFRELGIEDRELNDILVNECKLGFSRGSIFGKDGKGFQRMNIGCPIQNIKDALGTLKKQFGNY